MAWEVEVTDELADWFHALERRERSAVIAAVTILEDRGPALGRPLVDRVHGSRHQHMKELRPQGTNIRVLFAFDPTRTASLLIGGGKSGEWKAWYSRMIPVADDLYDQHIQTLREEGTSK